MGGARNKPPSNRGLASQAFDRRAGRHGTIQPTPESGGRLDVIAVVGEEPIAPSSRASERRRQGTGDRSRSRRSAPKGLGHVVLPMAGWAMVFNAVNNQEVPAPPAFSPVASAASDLPSVRALIRRHPVPVSTMCRRAPHSSSPRWANVKHPAIPGCAFSDPQSAVRPQQQHHGVTRDQPDNYVGRR